MKKKIIIAAVVIAVIASVCALVSHFVMPRTSDLSFADTIIVTDNYNGTICRLYKTEDKDIFDTIMTVCDKSVSYDPFDTPACMFERYNIVFTDGNKQIAVTPTDDDCDSMLMSIGNRVIYYYISDDEMSSLRSALASLPYVNIE